MVEAAKNTQDRMTHEIMAQMKDRKLCKGRDEDQYRALDRRIRKACDEAKEAWMNQQCEVIEDLQRHHNYAGLHQKVREITGKSRRNPTGCIKDKQGNVLFDEEDIVQRWAEYVEELYGDSNRTRDQPPLDAELSGSSILLAEVRNAVLQLKCGKAPGPDAVYTEYLKNIGDQNYQFSLTNISLSD